MQKRTTNIYTCTLEIIILATCIYGNVASISKV